MENITKEARLLALVADHPPGGIMECALARVRRSMGLCGVDLIRTAAELGFTASEAWGIMDGWDASAGQSSLAGKLQAHRPGYAEGFALGQRCWAARAEAQP